VDTVEAITHHVSAATPLRPTAEDVVLLAFAQQVELTIRDLYDEAIVGDVFADTGVRQTVTAIREAHDAYNQSLSSLLGRQAPNQRDQKLFDSLKKSFAADAASVTVAAANLENIGVATHTSLLGQLVGLDGARLIASILIVQARHAVVLNALAGVTDISDQLASDAEALVPNTNQ
jgi:hypothetical protein